MNHTLKFVLVAAACLVGGICCWLLIRHISLSNIEFEEMRLCLEDSDCIPVGCSCSCSGCGGFSFTDVINKRFAQNWYYKQDCKKSYACPEVCCPKREIRCIQRLCTVLELR